jgi:hypothetical protein
MENHSPDHEEIKRLKDSKFQIPNSKFQIQNSRFKDSKIESTPKSSLTYIFERFKIFPALSLLTLSTLQEIVWFVFSVDPEVSANPGLNLSRKTAPPTLKPY